MSWNLNILSVLICVFFNVRTSGKIAKLFKHFLIKSHLNISEQEKKRQKVYDLFNTETKPNFLCMLYTKQRKFIFTEKELFTRKKQWKMEHKTKKSPF